MINPTKQTPLVMVDGTNRTPRGMVTTIWFNWFASLSAIFESGFTGTVTTAKLTTGGTNGSMTFINGVVTEVTPAT